MIEACIARWSKGRRPITDPPKRMIARRLQHYHCMLPQSSGVHDGGGAVEGRAKEIGASAACWRTTHSRQATACVCGMKLRCMANRPPPPCHSGLSEPNALQALPEADVVDNSSRSLSAFA